VNGVNFGKDMQRVTGVKLWHCLPRENGKVNDGPSSGEGGECGEVLAVAELGKVSDALQRVKWVIR